MSHWISPYENREKEIKKKAADGIINHEQSMPVHTFPVRNKDLCDKWKDAISFMHLDHIKNFSRVRICQLHFQETDYKDGGAVRKRRELKEGIEPTVFSGVPKILQKTVSLLRNTKRAASSMRQKQL